MDNFEDLMQKYVLPWAELNRTPVENITFRCFLHIEKNAGLLSRYITLIVSEGASPNVRQSVNSRIAQTIAQHLNLVNTGREIQLPQGQFLINSYSILKQSTL